MNYEERKAATIKAFEEHEEMMQLLNCLSRSPAVFDEGEKPDNEDGSVIDGLIDRGHLRVVAGFLETTKAGREALINYINGQ